MNISIRISDPPAAKEILPESRIEEVPTPTDDSYFPRPYTFRASIPAAKRTTKLIPAEFPQFYLQLDHVIAVVWMLFSQDDVARPLDIAQLHWALQCLWSIRHRNGEHPEDVVLCIRLIQDELLEQHDVMVQYLQAVALQE